VVDIIRELQAYGVEVFVHDPQAEPEQALHEYNVRLLSWDDLPRADAVVAAVSHKEFLKFSIEDMSRKLVKGGALIDVKAVFDKKSFEQSGYKVWRL
jgi:UDP-N-acetyl-D-galactosamine dehydrogenase